MNKKLYSLIPRKALSYLMYKLARIKNKKIKNFIIKTYIKITGAKTDFAQEKDPFKYSCLNDFFTRPLEVGARTICGDISSPVDGRCAIYSTLEHNTLVQAKGIYYSASDLLGSYEWARLFDGGTAATLYLAPDDYHRIHMPCSGVLEHMRYLRGDKHSVAISLLDKIPNIFAGNERAVCLFNTEVGYVALVMVGALNVGSIQTVWHGEILSKTNRLYDYRSQNLRFTQGEEIGQFNLGSTVILFFQKNRIHWIEEKLQGQKVYLGEPIATR